MADLSEYPVEIRPLSQQEGGGFLITFVDFLECISDGETIDEAIQNGLDALRETVAALESKGYPVPELFPVKFGAGLTQKNPIYRTLLRF